MEQDSNFSNSNSSDNIIIMRQPELPASVQSNTKSITQKKGTKRSHSNENSNTENEPPKKVRITKAVKPKSEPSNIIVPSPIEHFSTIVTLPREQLLVSSRQDLDEFVKRQTGGRKLTKEEKLEVSRQRKLIKNRKSASASRKRKKEHLETLEESHRALAQENSDLKERLAQLENENKKMSNQVSIFSKLCGQYPFLSSAYDQYKNIKKQSLSFGMSQAVMFLLIIQLFLSLNVHFAYPDGTYNNNSKQFPFLGFSNNNNINNVNTNNINQNILPSNNIMSNLPDISLSSGYSNSMDLTSGQNSEYPIDHTLRNSKEKLDSPKEYGFPPSSPQTEKELVSDKLSSYLEYFYNDSDPLLDEVNNRSFLTSSTNFLEELQLFDNVTASTTSEQHNNNQLEHDVDIFSEILDSVPTNPNFTPNTNNNNNNNNNNNDNNNFFDTTPYNISYFITSGLDFHSLDEASHNNRCVEF